MRETAAMRRAAILAIGALLGAALWWRRNPSAMPYWQRFFVELPHPGITRERLVEVLEPRPRERLLEVGPGTGYYALTVAERLDGGRLEVYDLQKEMVDHVMRRTAEHGLTNVTGWTGDAQQMLFEDNRFDGAYLTVVLGEIPNQDLALEELARVVKPGGRVVGSEHRDRLGSGPARDVHEGLHDQLRGAALRQRHDQVAVDLQVVHRHVLQEAEGAEARAEVVECETAPDGAHVLREGAGALGIRDRDVLGHLEDQASGIDPRGRQLALDGGHERHVVKRLVGEVHLQADLASDLRLLADGPDRVSQDPLVDGADQPGAARHAEEGLRQRQLTVRPHHPQQ